jgi:hypothetical protein
MPMFKLQVQEDEQDASLWHDVKGADGEVLTFASRTDARARLEKLYPVLVKMEEYQADVKRTRVIAILDDGADEEWRGKP